MASAPPPLHKRLKRFVRYLVVRFAASLAGMFPVRFVSGLGAALGRIGFFGRLAATPRAAADLALRTGAALVVGTCPRVAPFRYRLSLVEVPVPETEGEAAVIALTSTLTRRLEEVIRAYPEQWVWMHERWKRRPPEEASPRGDVAGSVRHATPE